MNDDKQKSKNEIDSIFEPLKLFNDAPLSKAEHDALNFKDYADVIYESILGTDTPCTIGIFGEWGMGKTSMMNMTRDNIKEDSKNYISVWFNAWQYENEEHTIVPLIATIIKEIKKQIKELEKEPLTDETEEKVKMLEKVEKKVSWLHKVNNALRSVASGISIEASGNVPLVGEAKLTFNGKDMVSRYEELMKDAFLEKSLYFDAYEKMEELSSTNLDEKIVIFIDDLDRCLPDKAVKLLENIKLFLSQKGFVFVLGIAREVIESYLKKRYEEKYGNPSGNHGEAYLDKIIQIPIYIPSHHENTKVLTEKMFKQIEDESFDGNLQKILAIIAKKTDGNPRSFVRLINRIKINSRISFKIIKDSVITYNKKRTLYFAIACAMQEYFKNEYKYLTNSAKFKNACLDLTDKEKSFEKSTYENDFPDKEQKEIIENLNKSESLFTELLKNDDVREWLKNEAILKETTNFIKFNDNKSVIDKDSFDLDLIKRHKYWIKETKKQDKRNLKEFIKIDDNYDFSKYLVTNFWYNEFIEDKGYENEEYWKEQGSVKYLKKRIKDLKIESYKDLYKEDEEKFLDLSQPVVNISYYEAKAFSSWLTNKSKTNSENHTFDLPTKEQFKYVATKNKKDWTYPWGKEEDWNENYCNNANTNINSTSVVGIFPDGNSSFGVCDMSGNVWKWTSSKDKDGDLIVKGGSWLNLNVGFFSALGESDGNPDGRGNGLGFFLTRTK